MLSQLKDRFPGATFGAFTATADEATRNDIVRKLFPGHGTTIVQGFDRPNLRLAVSAKDNWRRQLTASWTARRAKAGSSIACRADTPRKWPLSWQMKVTTPSPITPARMPRGESATRTVS